ncbi:MAG TPA: hypothetical protein VGX23_31045 [Actinocrinis sp.]|nr:hypothetical protein [Actinocrinis sp.]
MRQFQAIVGGAGAAFAFLALAACQAAAGSGTPAASGNAEPVDGPGTGIAWSFTMASPTHDESPRDTLAVQYPVVSYARPTPGDASLTTTVNTKLKNVDEAFVTQFRSQFLNPTPVTVDGRAIPSQLQVTASASQVGELLSVRYDAFLDRSGSAGGFSEEQDLTIRMDTGATLGPADLLSPGALQSPGALAALIAPQLGGDYIFGGGSAADAVSGALSTIAVPVDGLTDPVVGVLPSGLDFTFQQGALTPMSNGTPNAVVPFGKLDGLVNPDIVTLAEADPK